mgnify:CR=1 FL=1
MVKQLTAQELMGTLTDQDAVKKLELVGSQPVTLVVTWHPVHGLNVIPAGGPSPALAQEILAQALRKVAGIEAELRASKPLTEAPKPE